MILDSIITHKRAEIKARMAEKPLESLQGEAHAAAPALDFKAALKRTGNERLRIIAEIKRRSPSKGLLALNFDPARIAEQYYEAGAAAVSVLTDEHYFGGSLQHLGQVRSRCCLPLLRKDFIIHPYQVYESRVWGADAVLLIVRALSKENLVELYRLIRKLGMHALVEVHGPGDIKMALDIGAEIIGINNRDLNTFQVGLEVTRKLAGLLPINVVVVSESGITARTDTAFLETLGVDAALVGEALMRSSSPGKALREMIQEVDG